MADGTPEHAADRAPREGHAAADPALARAALRRKRLALVFVTVIALAFISISCLQIIPAVFGAWIVPIPSSAPAAPGVSPSAGSAESVCAVGVRRLGEALDRASPFAGGPAFAQALRPEWDDEAPVEQACARTPRGLDAWAALRRLRSAQEQLSGTHPEALIPLRNDLASYLSLWPRSRPVSLLSRPPLELR